jgi:excisionase family DNA binding protein
MEDLLSVRQVANQLNLSRVQIVRLIQTGKIPAKKVGRSYVVSAKALRDHLIDRPVRRAVKDFGETLRRLGNE